jgi:hypothetical protein
MPKKPKKEWYEVHFRMELTGKKKVRASSADQADRMVKYMRATQLVRGYDDLHLDVTRTEHRHETP